MADERLDVDGIVASMVPDLIEDIQPVEASSGYDKCGWIHKLCSGHLKKWTVIFCCRKSNWKPPQSHGIVKGWHSGRIAINPCCKCLGVLARWPLRDIPLQGRTSRGWTCGSIAGHRASSDRAGRGTIAGVLVHEVTLPNTNTLASTTWNREIHNLWI